MFMLDDIHFFGESNHKSERHTEIDFLIDLLYEDFFIHEVSKPIQITYIGFLANLSYCSRKINFNHIPKCDIWNKGLLRDTLWNTIGGDNKNLTSFFEQNRESEWSVSDISQAHSNSFHIAFISLVKLTESKLYLKKFL